MWLLPFDALRNKDLTRDLSLYLIMPKNSAGVPAASSSLLRLCRQHKQFALELSKLSNIVHIIGECRHNLSGQRLGAFWCASSRFH